MKLSQGFWQTYKEIPAEAQIISHQLMLRAGLIHKSAAGIYNYLPVGYRSIRKIEQIVREEMDRAGALELLMSVVTPRDLWEESGRWDKMGDEMVSFKDKGGRSLCLSPTNEEVCVDIFRKVIKSYKSLPLNLYQINTKFRDEIRPRFGLMRGREFTMKDAYSFDMDKEGMDTSYKTMYETYERIFTRCGLEYFVVQADPGHMAEAHCQTHEFQVIAQSGEDEIVYCAKSAYAVNRELAATLRPPLSFDKNERPLTSLSTPHQDSIEKVCHFLQKPGHQALKSLLYLGLKGDKKEAVLIQLLGDDELNEVKLKNFLGADQVVIASEQVLEKYGFVRGYMGAAHLPSSSPPLRVLFDKAVDLEAFYIAGGGKKDTHWDGFCPRRDGDVEKFEVASLRLSQAGDLTEDGQGVVEIKRGIEVGHIFQLGDLYSKTLGARVLDEQGKQKAPFMGCYGIGVTRVMSAIIEQCHDDKGIIWPKAVAPYHLSLLLIGKSNEIKEEGEKLYETLQNEGYEVLYDDRSVGIGFKFKDAELLGLPFSVVLGEKVFQKSGELEIIERKSGKKIMSKRENILSTLKELYGVAP